MMAGANQGTLVVVLVVVLYRTLRLLGRGRVEGRSMDSQDVQLLVFLHFHHGETAGLGRIVRRGGGGL